MKLETRLLKLETAKRLEIAKRQAMEENGSKVRERFIEWMEETARRIIDGNPEMTVEWCNRRSVKELSAMCMHELGTGEHTFPLWHRYWELRNNEGAPGDFVRLILDQRAQGFRAMGYEPEEYFVHAENPS